MKYVSYWLHSVNFLSLLRHIPKKIHNKKLNTIQTQYCCSLFWEFYICGFSSYPIIWQIKTAGLDRDGKINRSCTFLYPLELDWFNLLVGLDWLTVEFWLHKCLPAFSSFSFSVTYSPPSSLFPTSFLNLWNNSSCLQYIVSHVSTRSTHPCDLSVLNVNFFTQCFLKVHTEGLYID